MWHFIMKLESQSREQANEENNEEAESEIRVECNWDYGRNGQLRENVATATTQERFQDMQAAREASLKSRGDHPLISEHS